MVRRGHGRELVELPGEVWLELMISTLLLPFAQFNLSAEWSPRVTPGRSIGCIDDRFGQSHWHFAEARGANNCKVL